VDGGLMTIMHVIINQDTLRAATSPPLDREDDSEPRSFDMT
jgi:hypothetical protein